MKTNVFKTLLLAAVCAIASTASAAPTFSSLPANSCYLAASLHVAEAAASGASAQTVTFTRDGGNHTVALVADSKGAYLWDLELGRLPIDLKKLGSGASAEAYVKRTYTNAHKKFVKDLAAGKPGEIVRSYSADKADADIDTAFDLLAAKSQLTRPTIIRVGDTRYVLYFTHESLALYSPATGTTAVPLNGQFGELLSQLLGRAKINVKDAEILKGYLASK